MPDDIPNVFIIRCMLSGSFRIHANHTAKCTAEKRFNQHCKGAAANPSVRCKETDNENEDAVCNTEQSTIVPAARTGPFAGYEAAGKCRAAVDDQAVCRQLGFLHASPAQHR